MSGLQFFSACITLPLIFLIIATAHQNDKAVKLTFIVLAYLWPLAFVGCLYIFAIMMGGDPSKDSRESRLFLLALAIISLWAIPLGCAGGRGGDGGDLPKQ
jgi:hypothetical protein